MHGHRDGPNKAYRPGIFEESAKLRHRGQHRIFHRFGSFDERKFVQPLPNVAGTPSAQHQFIAAFDVQVVEIAGFDSRTPLFDGTDIDRTGGKSQTTVAQRALRTAGLYRKTAKSPEIHNGLVVKSRPLPVDQRIGQRSERPPSGSRIDGRIEVVKAGKHPKDIAVECGTGFVVGDRTDRRSV